MIETLKIVRITVCTIGTLMALLLLNACQPASYGNNANVDADDADTENVPESDPEFAYGKSALGVKTYLQIYESMWAATKLESSTGLPRSDGNFSNIRNFYVANKASLPTNNNIESFTASHMLTISNLAWEFCDRLLEIQAARTSFFNGSAFADITNNTLHQPSMLLGTAAQREELAEIILNGIWGEETVTSPGRTAAQDELSDLTMDLLTGALADAQSTRNIIKGVCAASLASAAVSLF